MCLRAAFRRLRLNGAMRRGSAVIEKPIATYLLTNAYKLSKRKQVAHFSPAPAAPAVLPAPAASAAVHVVQPGETLGTISARYYGTPAKWSVLFNANRDRVPDANNVRVGTRLDIPPP